MITLSHSKREAFNCPYFFANRYILRTPSPKNINLSEGTLLHDVICVYTEQLFKNKLSNDSELMNSVFRELWKAQDVLPEHFHDNLYMYCRKFGERFSLDRDTIVWDSNGDIGVEYGIAFTEDMKSVRFPHLRNYEAEDEWCQQNGIWVHHRIDRIEWRGNDIVITDYKSYRRPQSETTLRNKGQGRQYAWSVFNHPEFSYVDKVYVVWDFIRFDNAQVEVEYTKNDVDMVEHGLRTLTEKINHWEEAKDPTEWVALQSTETCTICNYPCPLNKEGDIPTVIQDEKTAVELGQKLYAMNMQAKAINAALKNYTDGAPLVDIGIGTYGDQVSIGVKGLDPIKMVERLAVAGVDLKKILKVDAPAVKDMLRAFCDSNNMTLTEFMKKSPEDIAKLDPVMGEFRAMIKTLSTSTRFGFRPKEKPEDEGEEEE